MKSKYGVTLLLLTAILAFSTALAHFSCIFFGPECYSIQMAPEFIVESAKQGTIVAPIGAILAAILFIIPGCYALSGAHIIRKLPLLTLGIYTIATLCIIRGLLPIQLWLRKPDKVTDVVLYVGIVWLIAGLFYLFGYKSASKVNV
ncbi:hypothetical protein [Shewanella japonica]|uniref:DUF3995 domain-containing protein n=1 Tax=Shewanella japonica TaxID=93973 RepID=A0ABN4YER0_9GAMM|nr:hypothetical protein [Shewanella japonica]ARD21198.1 hypothetical protein SJ2017_0867 [Shewanella japonica]